MAYKEISGIYCIENMINGKKYIGLSKNIKRRVNEHFRFAKEVNVRYANNKLYNSIRKYGKDNFKWYILEECGISELEEKEIYYISKYDTTNNDFGYNNESGGKANIIVHNDTILKLKESQFKIPVILLDRYGNLKTEFESINEAYRITGIDMKSIRNMCEDNYRWCSLGLFCKKEDYYNGSYILNKDRFIVQLDTNGNYMSEYYSMSEASRKIKCSTSDMSHVLNKKRKTVKGYVFIYYKEYINRL